MQRRDLPMLVFAVMLIVLSGSAVLGCLAARRLITNDRQVAHSDDAVVDLQTLLAALRDAETSQRGYLLTDDAGYLRRYRSAASQIRLELGRLAHELTANPAQRVRLARLRGIVDRKLAQIERSVALERRGEHATALAVVDGKVVLMNEASGQIAAMQAAEYRLLDARAASSERSGETILLAIIVATVIGGALLALVLYLDRRTLRSERRAIEAIAAERERAMKDLRQADRHKDEFLALLAHELRGPLAPLRNGLELMKHASAGDPSRARKTCAMMERQLEQLVRLVNDLLDVSRISRNKIELRPERIALGPIIAECLTAVRSLADTAHLTVELHLPPEPLRVDADPLRLAQVFRNLLHNACKYTERGGCIEVRASAEHGEAVVRVKDSGVGIPPDQLESIFEMYMQVDRDPERSQGGLGIGLALVKRLVLLHGGTVAAASEGPGRGSEFVVRLPLARAGEARPASGVAADVALT
jgi:signal transduction histidine kinase